MHELSFDQDAKGQFHALVSTRARHLYYLRGEASLWHLAKGEDRFFPHVFATNRVFLGLREAGHGFRFRQFAPRGKDGHLRPLDPRTPI